LEFFFLLAMPLTGAVLLGIWGERSWAPRLNVAVSLATLLAACALTAGSSGKAT